MSYTTQEAVLLRLGRNGDLTTTTSPTLAEAVQIQDGITADIDAALAIGGLSVPVTTPAALVSWLAAVESWGTCAEILKARFQDPSGINSEATWAFFETRYQAAIAAIRTGTAVTLSGSPTMPQSYFTRNPDVDEDLGDLAEGGWIGVRMDL